jgi:hypothetical protein
MWVWRADGSGVGEVEPVEVLDGESGGGHRGSCVAAGVAASGQVAPDGGVQGALDAAQCGRLGLDVFEETQVSAGAQDPVDLAQCRVRVADAARDQ